MGRACENRRERIVRLCEAFVALKGLNEARAFLADLLTPAELDGVCRRWAAARMLYRGASQARVVSALKMGTSTVTRVNNALQGRRRGYRTVLMRTLRQ